MPLYIGLFAKTRQQVNCDCDCDDMHRRVAITEACALGVRNEKKILLSACYQHLTESLLQSFAISRKDENKHTTFAALKR